MCGHTKRVLPLAECVGSISANLRSLAIALEEVLFQSPRVIEVNRISSVWVIPSLCLLVVDLNFFLSLSEIIVLRQMILYPTSPGVEILLIA